MAFIIRFKSNAIKIDRNIVVSIKVILLQNWQAMIIFAYYNTVVYNI